MVRMRGDGETDGRESTIAPDRRRFLGLTAGAAGAAVLPGTASAADDADGETVTIVHDTHFHGRFEDAENAALNLPRYHAVVRESLADAENSLFVGNGDELAPSVLGLEYEGEHMIEALNETAIDVVGVGNHEYDFGADVATQRFEESEFPWVVANLLDDAGEPVPGTERWTTIDAGELTVGVFGLVSEGFHSLTDYPEEWTVLEAVESARTAVDALRDDGADVVVCASHVSTGVHYDLAESVEGLDAIVGSHSGVVFDQPKRVDGTVISEFGDEFDHVGTVTLDADGELADWQRIDLVPPEGTPAPAVDEYDEISVRSTDEIEPDDSLAELTETWLDRLADELGEPAFESDVELNATFDNYAIETNWGNLMTDAMRTVGEIGQIEVDIAAQNAGGIRSDSTYGPGEVTGADVMDILPFPNEIQVVEVTGEEVVAYLEEATRPQPDENFGAQPAIQVSGLSYEWWGHEGETRVENVFVGGEPIDPDETYYLAHNDYTIENSDVLSTDDVVLASGQFQGPYVLDRLEERDTVAPERENRMLRVDETVGEADVTVDGDAITLDVDVPDGAATIAPDTFRAVIRTGEEVAAESATRDGATVDVAFDADELRALVDGVDDPALRLFGRYDPDQAHWPYEFDVPTSDGYDRFQFRAAVDAAALEGESDGSESDGTNEDGENDDSDGSDGSTENESDDGNESSDDADDGMPGFGPVGAIGAGSAGAYLYARDRSDGGDPADDASETEADGTPANRTSED